LSCVALSCFFVVHGLFFIFLRSTLPCCQFFVRCMVL
jgi:hypothetical protein